MEQVNTDTSKRWDIRRDNQARIEALREELEREERQRSASCSKRNDQYATHACVDRAFSWHLDARHISELHRRTDGFGGASPGVADAQADLCKEGDLKRGFQTSRKTSHLNGVALLVVIAAAFLIVVLQVLYPASSFRDFFSL